MDEIRKIIQMYDDGLITEREAQVKMLGVLATAFDTESRLVDAIFGDLPNRTS